MILTEATAPPYLYRCGSSALIVSMPHVGTYIPASVGGALTDVAAQRPDTDWHLPRLYDFLDDLGATVIAATFSRYVVDLNRPPDNANLYPGQDTTGLVPVDTFDKRTLYRSTVPAKAEIARRVQRYWNPYHRRLASETARVKAEHGRAIVWDAHSIASRVPRFFEGRLADFNLGTARGASCDASLGEALQGVLERHREFTFVRDGRFTGGYITRHYGRPGDGVHAVQMEMAEAIYMDEQCPYTFRPELAVRARRVLREQLEVALAWAAKSLAMLAFALGLSVPAPAQSFVSDAGVPFVTTPDNVTLAMLELAKVGDRDYLIDLGSGDGRIVILAAKRFGARGLGVEIVPDLVRLSSENARRAGVEDRARFLEQDLFATDLSPATVVTMYLLPEVNMQLRDVVLRLKPGTRIVSHDWDMGSWKPDASIVVPAPDKKVGLEKTSTVFLWVIPAAIDGAWCTPGGHVLTLSREFQRVVGSIAGAGRAQPFEGRIDGFALRAEKGNSGWLVLALESDRLRISAAQGDFAALHGLSFTRRTGRACPVS